MIRFLLKSFFGEEGFKDNIQMRTKYSVFAGALGIVCNLALFAIKLITGIASSSIAIISDAFNNLSDTGTSVVTVIGAKLSSKRPDKEHPLGHGRVEYVSSLIVSFIIVFVGFELLKSSVQKFLNPVSTTLNALSTGLLCLTIPIKFWMYSYNRYIGKQINSGVLMATARDSINDVFATGAVIVSAIVGKKLAVLKIDGIVGAVVSLMIIHSGIKISFDTIGILLGAAPSPELAEGIRNRVLSAKEVVGVHDLIVHDYGPGRILASVHAEVSAECNVVEIHEVIDSLEKTIEKELGVHIVVHMDPVLAEGENVAKTRKVVLGVVKAIDESLSIHDFKMNEDAEKINLIFDVDVPSKLDGVDDIDLIITKELKKIDARFSPAIKIDYI
ncbi:MAG: cation transporter [Clostridia bacterium]|nr:cation transporter [Clostridia bacterium]